MRCRICRGKGRYDGACRFCGGSGNLDPALFATKAEVLRDAGLPLSAAMCEAAAPLIAQATGESEYRDEDFVRDVIRFGADAMLANAERARELATRASQLPGHVFRDEVVLSRANLCFQAMVIARGIQSVVVDFVLAVIGRSISQESVRLGRDGASILRDYPREIAVATQAYEMSSQVLRMVRETIRAMSNSSRGEEVAAFMRSEAERERERRLTAVAAAHFLLTSPGRTPTWGSIVNDVGTMLFGRWRRRQ